ncbi:FAD-dependent monooxygenase [Paludisphaera rhizosphaerae]|uniref:FAD-dependent monooxygenase n=1 Tax=Paludisphaera rhizosphaerae TaxID=2711216 RepID=UPI0013EBD783|nr:FAD-dependent monooxygenase [Paludisphaera rhizosphaerae]
MPNQSSGECSDDDQSGYGIRLDVGSVYDAVVFGGGPAGAAAALELTRRGATVILLERSRYDLRRVGETLSPEAAGWLVRLGLGNAVPARHGLPSPGVVAAWDSDEPVETDFLFAARGHGWHVDRTRFDADLVDAAEAAGAQVFRGARPRDFRRAGHGWRVNVEIGGRGVELSARWLLDATGRAGWLTRRLGVKPDLTDPLIAVVARFDHAIGPDRRLLVEAVLGGWWYLAPLPDARGVAVFLTDADLLRPEGAVSAWKRGLSASRLIHERLGEGRPAEVRVVAAGTRWTGTVAGPGWLAIGDSTLAHDPLTGSGVGQALAAGWEGAAAVASTDDGDADAIPEYQRSAEAKFGEYIRQCRAMYRRAARWPTDPFWSRRLAAGDHSV